MARRRGLEKPGQHVGRRGLAAVSVVALLYLQQHRSATASLTSARCVSSWITHSLRGRHFTPPSPLLKRLGHEFGAVIDGDRNRYAELIDHPLQAVGNASSGVRKTGL